MLNRPIVLDILQDIEDKIKIVHISDLHFGKESDEIKHLFMSFIQNYIPHFIVAAGDGKKRVT